MFENIIILDTEMNNISKYKIYRGKLYVETYIKTTMMGDEEFMQWVENSWQEYAYRHINSLVQQRFGSVLGKKRLKDAIEQIETLYANEQDFEDENATNSSKKITLFEKLSFKNNK
jgi:hypothetical protein